MRSSLSGAFRGEAAPPPCLFGTSIFVSSTVAKRRSWSRGRSSVRTGVLRAAGYPRGVSRC